MPPLCQKTSVEDRDAHMEICKHWRCSHCCKRILLSEERLHRETCDFIKCRKCGLKGQGEEVLLHACTRRKCPRCSKLIRLEQYDDHYARCSYIQCETCDTRMPFEKLANHKPVCGSLISRSDRDLRYQYKKATQAIFVRYKNAISSNEVN